MTGIKLDNFNASINTWYHVLLKVNHDGTVTCNMNNKTYTAPATSFDSTIHYIQFIFATPSDNTEIRFKNLLIWAV